MKRRIGILGGTFNPVHNTHLFIASKVQEALSLDEVRLMPTYLPPHKSSKSVISAKHRLAMLEKAVAQYPYLSIETFEIEQQKKLYSYETMKQLTARHPDEEYFFIIGGDMIESLSHWYHIESLKELVTFVGVGRVGYQSDEHDDIYRLDLPLSQVSSSYIRDEVASGRRIDFLVPASVLNYIQEEGLYGYHE